MVIWARVKRKTGETKLYEQKRHQEIEKTRQRTHHAIDKENVKNKQKQGLYRLKKEPKNKNIGEINRLFNQKEKKKLCTEQNKIIFTL